MLNHGALEVFVHRNVDDELRDIGTAHFGSPKPSNWVYMRPAAEGESRLIATSPEAQSTEAGGLRVWKPGGP